MNAVLYCREKSRRRLGLSFLAALAIQIGAVALAGIHPVTPLASGIGNPAASTVIVDFWPSDLPPESSPLIEEVPPPKLPELPEFIEPEAIFNSVKPRPHSSPDANVRDASPGGPTTMRAARAFVVFSPRPGYPYEARRRNITGQGTALMNVDAVTGRVTGVTMLSSTGSALLDQSTMAALRRWKFRPGSVERVRCPITFTLSGAQY